jgi:hypothetical protein
LTGRFPFATFHYQQSEREKQMDIMSAYDTFSADAEKASVKHTGGKCAPFQLGWVLSTVANAAAKMTPEERAKFFPAIDFEGA